VSEGNFWGAIACLCYSIASLLTTFSNKALFEIFSFKLPLTLLVYQHFFTTFGILTINRGSISEGTTKVEYLDYRIVKIWYPVNLLFVGMLISGNFALQSISVPMVTIFKNLSTTLTAIGDNRLYGQPLSFGIISSMVLMVMGSVIAGYNDLQFDFNGYMWMFINCGLTASYVLYMKVAIKATKLTEFGLVFYNNFLALPTLFPIIYFSEEVCHLQQKVYGQTEVNASYGFMGTVFMSGICGLAISLTSFWAMKTTSPTTYSFVGSLNKIPLVLLGFLIFDTQITPYGGVGIFLGLIGGISYTYSKYQQSKQNVQSNNTVQVVVTPK